MFPTNNIWWANLKLLDPHIASEYKSKVNLYSELPR